MADSLYPQPDPSIRIIKVGESGDKQSQKAGSTLNKPIRIRVVNDSLVGVEQVPVTFRILNQPKKSVGFGVADTLVYTDSTGIASTEITLGNKEGDYQCIAEISTPIVGGGYQIFTFQARKNNWIFFLVIGLLGGLGLFLLGMEMMSEGLKKSAGDKMRTLLGSLTRNRLLALGVGTFVTMIIQSSSATSVMLVGFVNSKLMKFKRTIGIILGANIGTTFTVQLIAFNISEYSLLMIAAGFGLMSFTKRQGYKSLGQSILGFGILFFGMKIMSDAMYPLRSFEPFIALLQELENPLLGITVGILFTALIQSSGAFIGITIVLASQGLITLDAAIPLLLGSNIGTAITAFLASINASREAKKVALANALINVFGMLLVVGWIPGYAHIIAELSPGKGINPNDVQSMAEVVPRQIANAHTFFNVMLALIILPVSNSVAAVVDRILPEKESPEEALMKTQFLDENLISTPVLGLNLAKQESLRIAGIVQDMLSDIILPFLLKESNVIPEIIAREKQVDFLTDEVSNYLTRLIRQDVQSTTTQEAFQIMYTVKELEEISDIVGNLLVVRAEKWIAGEVEFSEEGKKELLEYHTRTAKQLSRAVEVFRDLNLEKARVMQKKNRKYRAIATELEKLHYGRIRSADKKLESSGDTHMELMTRFRTITHHATNIARIHLDRKSS